MLFPNPFVYQRTLEADIKSATIPSMLEQHYGQCGEDLIIFSIARALQTQGHIRNWADYVYVEIGGNHAFAGNNTYLLHIHTGMTGILVEANPALLPDLQKGRPADQIIHAAITNEDVETVELFVSNHHELSSLHKELKFGMAGRWGLKTACKWRRCAPIACLKTIFQRTKRFCCCRLMWKAKIWILPKILILRAGDRCLCSLNHRSILLRARASA